MTDGVDGLLALESAAAHRFADWPNLDVPAVAAGVYTIWDGATLVYVGMAGRSLTVDSVVQHRSEVTKVTGLRSRLNSHASGRRSGDQFCLYVCDLLVLPTLASDTIARIADREIKLDDLVRDYVRGRLCYRYLETSDGHTARSLEADVRGGHLAAGKPLLNPLA